MEYPIELLSDAERRQVERTPEEGFIPTFEKWAGLKTDASKFALKSAALTALSLAAGDTTVLPPFFGSQPIYMNLYIMLVGPSTVMRKTTVLGFVKDLLPVNELTQEGYIKFLDDVSIQAFNREMADAGKVQSPLLMNTDEVAGMFQLVRNKSGSYLAGFDKTLLKAYDHSAVHIARVGKSINVEQGAFVNVFAATTPEPLLEVLDSDDVESGLLPRFIVFDVREAQRGERIKLSERLANQERWEEIQEELRNHLGRIAINRSSGVPTKINERGRPEFEVTTLQFSDEALERLDKLDETFNRNVIHDSSAVAAIKGRAFWHVVKLSGLYALSRAGAGATVELIDVLHAMSLVETTIADLFIMKDEVGATLLERRINEVRALVKPYGSMKQSTIMRRLKLSAGESKELFATLSWRGHIKVETNAADEIIWVWVD